MKHDSKEISDLAARIWQSQFKSSSDGTAPLGFAPGYRPDKACWIVEVHVLTALDMVSIRTRELMKSGDFDGAKRLMAERTAKYGPARITSDGGANGDSIIGRVVIDDDTLRSTVETV